MILLYIFFSDVPIWGRVEDECATGDSLSHPAMAILRMMRRLVRLVAHRVEQTLAGDGQRWLSHVDPFVRIAHETITSDAQVGKQLETGFVRSGSMTGIELLASPQHV